MAVSSFGLPGVPKSQQRHAFAYQGGKNLSCVSLVALLNGRFDLAMQLIGRGADPNLITHDDGISPLFAVLQTQWSLLHTDPQPRAHDNQQTEYMDVLNALLEAGADPNVRLKTHLYSNEYTLLVAYDINGVLSA